MGRSTPAEESFTPYPAKDEDGKVRAALLAAGHSEWDPSVSDFIVRATMREAKTFAAQAQPQRDRCSLEC